MLKEIVFLLAGFVLLIKGADWLVGGASALARKHNVSDLVIGLTIVAFGTSAPELVVSLIAAINRYEAVSLANVIGSNNFNLFIVMGIAGLIRPLAVKTTTVWREIPFSLFAAVLLWLLANSFIGSRPATLSRVDGLIFLAFFALFLWYLFRQSGRDTGLPVQEEPGVPAEKRPWIYIATGLAGLIFGGRIVVNNAIELATMLGMSEKMIGLTIVAGGTSLPELATSVTAAFRKNADIAVGNVIGSNIFNILLILGISSVVQPLGYDISFNTDMYVLAGGTALLFLAMFTGGRRRLDRWEAALLLIIYGGYMMRQFAG